MKRSMSSVVAEKVIRATKIKRHFTQKKHFERYMERMKKKRLKPYRMPTVFMKRTDVVHIDMEGMDTYLLRSDECGQKPRVLYLHGGGYTSDPLPFHWAYLLRMKERTGADFHVPVYPKLPAYTYKDAFEKVYQVYLSLLSETNPENLVFMGDSAGGGFVLALAMLIRDKGMPGPRDIVMLSPWLDITMTNPDMPEYEKTDPSLGIKGLAAVGRYWAGGTDPNHYLLSPVNGSYEGLGRMSMFMGTRELLLPDGRRFRSIARAQDVPIRYYEYPGMIHAFPFYPIPEAREANEIIADSILGF